MRQKSCMNNPSHGNLRHCSRRASTSVVENPSRCCYCRQNLVCTKVGTVSGHKSKRENQKARFFVISNYQPCIMKPPGAPRQPLGEVSPNQRSRVVSAYDHGIKVSAILARESLSDSTCRSIIKNASHQVLCITPPRPGRPSVLTPGDHRLIRRAIVVNPKIIAQQLKVSCVPHSSKKTIYRYLLKLGIQK